ncbi:hypothetical protein B0H12DRAFT_1120744 [Mycena haematopus]|nr:hypothetical protein B0H12DRAFT_1120744 [Mycena haematopus]
MTTSLSFPPELHDLVVDHMHDQKHALGTCGLVNKAWLISSRYHLFASVTLRDDNWKDFVQLLESPLASFAQSIAGMTISSSGSFNELISRLRRFSITLKRLRLENVYWTGVTDITIDALVAMFPDIRELDLYQVVFDTPRHMAALVSRFLQLRTASLSPLFLRDGAFQASGYEMPRNLEHLRLRLHLGVALWFYAGASFQSIRVLELGILDARSLPSIGNLLHSLGPQLRDLNLKLMYHVTPDDIRAHVDLSRNSNLHSLTIHVSVRRFQRTSSMHAPWALLAAPHFPINTLTIVLSVDIVDLIDNLDWQFLNTALKIYTHFSALRQLNFIAHCSSTMDTMEEMIRARVPEYNTRGMVEVVLMKNEM